MQLLQAGRNDFHVHTCASDAAKDCTVERIARVAEGLQLRGIGITDHRWARNAARGWEPGRADDDLSSFLRTRDEIRALQGEAVRLYLSWEVDYLEGGLYSFDPEAHLPMLDYVLLAYHCIGQRSKDEPAAIARRLLDIYLAMAQEPYANLIAHPFYLPPPPDRHAEVLRHITDAQFAEVFLAMKEHGKAAEITAYQFNADLRGVDEMVRMYAVAHSTGVKCTLDSDAHSLWDLGESLRCSYVLASMGFTDADFVDYQGMMALRSLAARSPNGS